MEKRMKSSLSTVVAMEIKFGSVAALVGTLSACVIAPHHGYGYGYGRVDQSGPVVVQAAPVVVAPAPPVVVVRPAVRYGWYGHRYYR
jgi:hypothetical protein